MTPPESSDPTTVRPEYSNTAETHENNLKNNFMKMREAI